MRRQRGRCRYCGHGYALTNAGRIWAHPMPAALGHCPGSGQLPS